jgi:hypothetical protein
MSRGLKGHIGGEGLCKGLESWITRMLKVEGGRDLKHKGKGFVGFNLP